MNSKSEFFFQENIRVYKILLPPTLILVTFPISKTLDLNVSEKLGNFKQ